MSQVYIYEVVNLRIKTFFTQRTRLIDIFHQQRSRLTYPRTHLPQFTVEVEYVRLS
jgi:hypothetical protein